MAPVLLGLTVIVGPQLLGGAYGWGISIIAGVAGAACLAAAWTARADGQKIPMTLVGWAAIGALAWTALQALPLPRALTMFLQPDAVEMADAAARLLGEPERGWIPLSISPYGTLAEIVKGAAVVATFLAASLLVGLGHRNRVATLVAASTALMALVALGHLAADADAIFGVVEAPTALLAPLFNSNQLSGFLAMGVPLLVGLALDRQDQGQRVGVLVAAAVVGATVLLAVSRGGVASLVAGLLVLGLLAILRRRSGRHRSLAIPLVVIGGTLATAVGLGLYVGSEALYRDFEQGDASKLELTGRALGLALDHPWVGVGRGAFSVAFVSVMGSDSRYTHPENFLGQLASEWGFVVAALVLGALLVGALQAVREARSWTHLGAIAALASIATHELVDFATERVGVTVVVAALAAVVLAPGRRGTSVGARTFRTWPTAIAMGGVALASVAIVGWRIDATNVDNLRGELEAHMEEGDHRRFAALLEKAVRLHPAEPAFALLAGAEAVGRDDPRALPWLNRAMIVAPGWDAPHEQTARWLAGRGRLLQAFLELREAEEMRPGGGGTLPCSILRERPEVVDRLVRAARDDVVGIAWLERVAHCLPLDSAAAVALDEVLSDHGALGARVRIARRQLGVGDPRAALRTLAPVANEHEDDVVLLRARAYLANDEPERAARVLEAAMTWTHSEGILRVQAEAQVAAGDADGMRETMEAVRGRAAGRTGPLAAAWIFQGRLEQGLGNDGRAMQAYERAHRLEPESGALAQTAALSERLGDLGRAYRSYAELCRLAGPSSPHCAARDRVRGHVRESPTPFGQPLATP